MRHSGLEVGVTDDGRLPSDEHIELK